LLVDIDRNQTTKQVWKRNRQPSRCQETWFQRLGV